MDAAGGEQRGAVGSGGQSESVGETPVSPTADPTAATGDTSPARPATPLRDHSPELETQPSPVLDRTPEQQPPSTPEPTPPAVGTGDEDATVGSDSGVRAALAEMERRGNVSVDEVKYIIMRGQQQLRQQKQQLQWQLQQQEQQLRQQEQQLQ